MIREHELVVLDVVDPLFDRRRVIKYGGEFGDPESELVGFIERYGDRFGGGKDGGPTVQSINNLAC